MGEDNKTILFSFLKENAITLIIAMFAAGSTWGVLKVENLWRDAKIAELRSDAEKAQIRLEAIERGEIEQKTIINQNKDFITVLQNDNKSLQFTVSDIKAKIDVLSSQLSNQDKKMDQLIQLLKENKHN